MKNNKIRLILLMLVSVWLIFTLILWILNINILNFNTLSTNARTIILFAAVGLFILALDVAGSINQSSNVDAQVIKHKQTTLKTSYKAMSLPPLDMLDLSDRPRYAAFSTVDNGSYLELTQYDDITYHVVDVTNKQLPDTLQENNQFVSISQDEKSQLTFSNVETSDIESYPPGSYQDAGYYIEIDTNHNIVDHIKYTEKRLPPTTAEGHRWIKLATQKVKNNGTLEVTLELPQIKLENFKDRLRYEALAQVTNGYYLEITTQDMSTDRVINVQNEVLPKALIEDNTFIEVSASEKQMIQEKNISGMAFEKFTPGSYTSPGYYIEVNIDNEFVDNIKYTETRLPPTTAKGHRWVHFKPRTIQS